MKAMLLHGSASLAQNPEPLTLETVPAPVPGSREAVVRVFTCAVCHTELDEIEGRLPPSALPRILGHQVVGVIEELPTGARGAEPFRRGQRVGVAWIYDACGRCKYCRTARENLCPEFRGTGRDADGGYAEFMRVPVDFLHLLPDSLSDGAAAPLLCAGAIGYRSLRLAQIEDGALLGLVGFGGSGHLVLKTALHLFPHSQVFVFSRNAEERELARSLGAAWTGAMEDDPPELISAIIETTPVWAPVLAALKRLKPGGRLVINAIRKEHSDTHTLTTLDYAAHLWMEKQIQSVANVTRADVREFLALAGRAGITPEYQLYDLNQANVALAELRRGEIRGAKVLQIVG